jgi:hypothetical protein
VQVQQPEPITVCGESNTSHKGQWVGEYKNMEVLNARQTSDGGGEENEQRLHKVRKVNRPLYGKNFALRSFA